MPHILVINDDLHIVNLLEELLRREHYRVSHAYSGAEALVALSEVKPDLVLLDPMFPGLSEKELLSQLEGIPVIVLSAKAEVDRKLVRLLGGAVDCVTKPFDTRELLARVAVALRNAAPQSAVLTFSELRMDTVVREVTACGHAVRLTRTEFAILKLLLNNPTQVITKSLLLDRIRVDTPDCTENSLKMHVSNLRRKLREAAGEDYIEAVWGIGFQLRNT